MTKTSELDTTINPIVEHQIEDELQNEQPNRLERLSDFIAEFGGSWKFMFLFTLFFVVYIIVNIYLFRFDPYPFMALTLIVSLLAIYQAPFILMSQNRMSDIDRKRELRAYKIAMKSEMELKDLHEKIDKLLELIQNN